MPTFVMSLLKCTAYIVRAAVLLRILVEAYSFINPSNYSAYYGTLRRRPDEICLSSILAALKDVIRLVCKIVGFTFSVDCALWIFGVDWDTDEIDTPREWGMEYYLDLPTGVYAFRWAVPRNFWLVRWIDWCCDFEDWVIELLIGFADGVGNWVVAG